jgi:hypothetical protein
MQFLPDDLDRTKKMFNEIDDENTMIPRDTHTR